MSEMQESSESPGIAKSATGQSIKLRSAQRAAEVAWFSALCGDDYEFLGVPDGKLRSSFEHCSDIVRTAERLGYQNILLPSSYQPGQDPLSFAAAMAVQTKRISQLVALRMGEVHPPMLARAISTVDHIARGRFNINIISSDLYGMKEESELRYRRSKETIEILRQCWTKDQVDFEGEFYKVKLPDTLPVKPYQTGGPLLYFGGISDPAKELCAQYCDVFLMWPETEERLGETMADMTRRAESFGRRVDFGLRIHVVVRESESEARDYARRLVSKLDGEIGLEIKHRAQDSDSAGVLRQDALRADADLEGYIEDHLWSGIGRARSGCGSALVGDPDQIVSKLNRYMDMGIRAFILSGYPHVSECELFARHVLPRLDFCKLGQLYGKITDEEPVTPLTTAPRV